MTKSIEVIPRIHIVLGLLCPCNKVRSDFMHLVKCCKINIRLIHQAYSIWKGNNLL